MSISGLLVAVIVIATFVCRASPVPMVANVVTFGAKPLGVGASDATKAFQAAWATVCGSAKPATLYVPKGRFLLGGIVFQGPCRTNAVSLRVDGTLVAASNYNAFAADWIEFDRVDGLAILGGTLDGNGGRLWSCKKDTGRKCPLGAASLSLGNCKNVKIIGLTSINSKFFHMFIHDSEGVTVQGGRITAPVDSPNTDGIHVQMSSGVAISSTSIQTGDDCVSIGPGSSDISIESVSCGPGHGISIGSLGHTLQEPGVQNVTVKSVVFTGTQNGLRIKTIGRPSSGFVKRVVFQHVIMKGVQNPIIIDQNYCPNNRCPNLQHSGIRIMDVMYSDIQGTSATEVAVTFDCSPSNPCRGIKIQDVKLTYQNKPAKSSCKYVLGSASGAMMLISCLSSLASSLH